MTVNVGALNLKLSNHLFRWLFSFVFMLAATNMYAVSASGTCGDNLNWSYDNTNTFTLSGSGSMTDYSFNYSTSKSTSPWNALTIDSVVYSGSLGCSIGNYAFYGNTALKKVRVPLCTSVGDYAFYHCSSLTSVEFTEVSSIGNGAFQNCTQLTSAKFDKATSIGNNAFNGCKVLNEVSLPNATSTGDYSFNGCIKLTSVVLPSATSISNSAFYGCVRLNTVVLPKVTSIGSDAFSSCPLSVLVVLTETAPNLTSTSLANIGSSCTLYYPAGSESAYAGWKNVSNRVALTHKDAVAATCSTPGSVAGWYSADNSIVITDDYEIKDISEGIVPILSHSFNDNGFCSCCGAYQPATFIEENNNYEIANAGQLYWFASLVNDSTDGNTANAILADNISVRDNLNENGALDSNPTRLWKPIGSESRPFEGSFNGAGHTIRGLYYNGVCDYAGIFGYNNGTIKSVGIEACSFASLNYVGAVCGFNENTIANCYNTGAVSGSANVGGICGQNSATGTVANCYNTGSVNGNGAVGGVCGSGLAANCYYLASESNGGDAKTAKQFASSEVALLLQMYVDENNGKDALVSWSQTVGDVSPSFGDGGIEYMREKQDIHWGSLCLPYAVSSSNATFFTVVEMDGDMLILKPVDEVEAGKPVIYYCTDDSLEVSIDEFGSSALAQSPVNSDYLVGAYETASITADNTYYLKDDKFYSCNGSFVVNPFKAYIQLSEEDNDSKVKQVLRFNFTDNTTLVDTVADEDSATDGTIEDVHIEAIYDIKGQRVTDMQKNGIYLMKMSDGTTQKAVVR